MEVKYEDLGETLLVKMFGRSPKLRILDIFMDNPHFEFSKSELVKELGMSKRTLYKNFKDLEDLGIIKASRRVGRAVMYRLNLEHPLVRRLNEIINEVSLEIAEREMKAEAVPVRD